MPESNQPVNRSEGIFKCADRVSPGDMPRDITSLKQRYLPLDVTRDAIHARRNPFGVVIYKSRVSAGNIYPSFDGRRLVMEVGCNTIIYILINQNLPAQHHRLFIQSDAGFSADTTIRRDASEIAHNTRHVETIVKYEMYFIMGVMSTLSVPAWLAVTGSDITYTYSRKKVMADAARALAKTILKDLDEIKTYAPTLHRLIWRMVISESNAVSYSAIKEVPSDVASNEKVQAQVAGIIFGKWSAPHGNPFNAWVLISTLLGQAVIKSSLAYPDTYLKILDARYKPLAQELQAVDASNPRTLVKPAQTLAGLMKENGVPISAEEMNSVIREIQRSPKNAYRNLSSIAKAIYEFKRVANG
jgi:hypothetical protein